MIWLGLIEHPKRTITHLGRVLLIHRFPSLLEERNESQADSFWSLLQKNVLNQRSWTTRQQLRLAIVIWIERKYRRQRPQDALGGLTPVEFEAKLTPAANLAA